jgi:Nop53 (60S ribosomal biogenesis)
LEEEMSAEKVEMAKNKDMKLKSIEKKSLLPKQMSRHKYEAPEFDFNMPKDIKGSVRKLKTEGSILVDRFKSMQKRNVIETRVRHKYDDDMFFYTDYLCKFILGSRGSSDLKDLLRRPTRLQLFKWLLNIKYILIHQCKFLLNVKCKILAWLKSQWKGRSDNVLVE